jgi:hypothetical protein
MLRGYVDASKPCIGPPRNHPKVNACNHFDVADSLLELYPHLLKVPLERVSSGAVRNAARLLDSFPYLRYLSSVRRKLMLKVLEIRADKMMGFAERLA